MNIKTSLKTTVAAAALFAVAVPVAEAGSVSSGGDTMSVTLSGHFNKAMAYVQSGEASGFTIADNDISQSRFRIIAAGKVNEQVSVSGTMEMSYSQNNLSGIGIVDGTAVGAATGAGSVSAAGAATAGTPPGEAGGGDSFGVRHGYLKFTHASMGSLSIGHTSVATDGAALVAYNPAGDAVDAGGAVFQYIDVQATNAADNTFTGLTVGQFFANYDGGRTDVIKYQTPNMGGFDAVVSFDSGQNLDAALNFSGKFGGISAMITGGYSNTSASSATVDSKYMVSGGLKHDSGLSISAGYAKEDTNNTTQVEGNNFWVIGAYEASLTSMGSTGFAVQYMKSEEDTIDGDEGVMWVVGVQQGIASGMSVYASANFYELDRPTATYEDVTGFFVGTKVAF